MFFTDLSLNVLICCFLFFIISMFYFKVPVHLIPCVAFRFSHSLKKIYLYFNFFDEYKLKGFVCRHSVPGGFDPQIRSRDLSETRSPANLIRWRISTTCCSSNPPGGDFPTDTARAAYSSASLLLHWEVKVHEYYHLKEIQSKYFDSANRGKSGGRSSVSTLKISLRIITSEEEEAEVGGYS